MTQFKRWFAAISLATIAIPWSAMAATSDQLLDKAVKSMDGMTSYKMDFEMNMDIGERVIGKPKDGMTGQIKIRISSRILDKENGEGRLALDRFTISGKESGSEISFNLDQPVAIDWIITDKKLYFNLSQAPATLLDFAHDTLGLDLSPLVGTWIGIDMPNGVNDIKDLPLLSSTAVTRDLPQNLGEQAAIRKLPIFRVNSIEKRMKNASGDDILRLRVRVNPSLIYAVQQAEIKALPRDKYYRTELTALNKRYVELRTNLAKIGMAINLNVTKNRVDRMELGGNIQEPTQTCTYDARLKRNVCKTSSIRTYKFSVGINIAPAGSTPVTAPFMWKTVEEIMSLLEPKAIPEPDPLVQVLTAQ